jgi:hypothetical protein
LKKILEEQNGIKNKLALLQKKKESSSYMQKDLSDLVYEQKLSKDLFVNTHGSTIMTTILIVVPKPKLNQFEGIYMTALKNQRAKDYEQWKKRTLMSIQQSDEIKGM